MNFSQTGRQKPVSQTGQIKSFVRPVMLNMTSGHQMKRSITKQNRMVHPGLSLANTMIFI